MAVNLNAGTFDQFLREHSVVLADFYKDGCVACRRIAPLLTQTEAAWAGRAEVARVNLSGSPEIAGQYAIQATPTLILFREGLEIARHRGVISKDELDAFLEEAFTE
ncbi:MAG: thioredoxin family protein [Bacillota bacterium]|nr:thioredoxin family protein [Bacillota bacterium]